MSAASISESSQLASTAYRGYYSITMNGPNFQYHPISFQEPRPIESRPSDRSSLAVRLAQIAKSRCLRRPFQNNEDHKRAYRIRKARGEETRRLLLLHIRTKFPTFPISIHELYLTASTAALAGYRWVCSGEFELPMRKEYKNQVKSWNAMRKSEHKKIKEALESGELRAELLDEYQVEHVEAGSQEEVPAPANDLIQVDDQRQSVSGRTQYDGGYFESEDAREDSYVDFEASERTGSDEGRSEGNVEKFARGEEQQESRFSSADTGMLEHASPNDIDSTNGNSSDQPRPLNNVFSSPQFEDFTDVRHQPQDTQAQLQSSQSANTICPPLEEQSTAPVNLTNELPKDNEQSQRIEHSAVAISAAPYSILGQQRFRLDLFEELSFVYSALSKARMESAELRSDNHRISGLHSAALRELEEARLREVELRRQLAKEQYHL
ncbi:hypothetical protein BJ508DRAFT_304241 [Ascobolus immersus RN42]|uniref:Uncharacterized protein n=1 Tax=Ascobolus immersus RN42 TaxID=1160509 RepID=A0A3N4IF50_ASCIM|nr:hypothetical protein BJ508DRAFT_304241 [Ascobolus immersus RN42]